MAIHDLMQPAEPLAAALAPMLARLLREPAVADALLGELLRPLGAEFPDALPRVLHRSADGLLGHMVPHGQVLEILGTLGK